jgi:hypothetical protein
MGANIGRHVGEAVAAGGELEPRAKGKDGCQLANEEFLAFAVVEQEAAEYTAALDRSELGEIADVNGTLRWKRARRRDQEGAFDRLTQRAKSAAGGFERFAFGRIREAL